MIDGLPDVFPDKAGETLTGRTCKTGHAVASELSGLKRTFLLRNQDEIQCTKCFLILRGNEAARKQKVVL